VGISPTENCRLFTAHVKVQAFLNDRPANRFTYSITWETNMDLKMVMGLSGIDVLMQQAESDVRQGLQ